MAQQQAGYRCTDREEHRQFDFWLGHWQVTDENAERVYGENHIEVRDNGCVILERYSTQSGFSGSSINYYDPSDGQWHQHWVDNGTSIIQTAGGIVDDSMAMSGRIYYFANARETEFRGLWTPREDGTVRQFFEEKDDKGDWQVWFEGFYRPMPAASAAP